MNKNLNNEIFTEKEKAFHQELDRIAPLIDELASFLQNNSIDGTIIIESHRSRVITGFTALQAKH